MRRLPAAVVSVVCLCLLATGLAQAPDLPLPDLSTPAAQRQAALNMQAALQDAIARARSGTALLVTLRGTGAVVPVDRAALQRALAVQAAIGVITDGDVQRIQQQLAGGSPAATAAAEQQLAAIGRFATTAAAAPGQAPQAPPARACDPPAPMNIRDGQEAALTLRSGACVSGVLIDFGADFTMRVNGADRRVPRRDVAVIDFTIGGSTAGTPPPGGHLTVLRNGQELRGELYDISARRPLRITLSMFDGQRDLSSDQVDRIVLLPVEAVAGAPAPPPGGGGAARFGLTGVSVAPTVVSDMPAQPLSATWAGDPRFPVTLVFAPDACPAGVNCQTLRRTFDTPANPLVIPEAAYCRGVSTSVFFDYSVYLQDATGAQSARLNADVTCVPRGAAAPPPPQQGGVFQITRADYNPVFVAGSQAADIAVWWTGNPRFPVNLIFAPDSCPPNLNCSAVVRTFNGPSNPFIGAGMVWCAGYSGVLDYSLRLEDANGVRSPLVNADVTCRSEPVGEDQPRFTLASWGGPLARASTRTAPRPEAIEGQQSYEQRRAELQAMLQDIDSGTTLFVPHDNVLVPVDRETYIRLIAGAALAPVVQSTFDASVVIQTEPYMATARRLAREAAVATRALRDRLAADIAVLNGLVGSAPGGGALVFDPRNVGEVNAHLQAEWMMSADFGGAPPEFRSAAAPLLSAARLVLTRVDCAPQPPLLVRCSMTGSVILMNTARQTILDLRMAAFEVRDGSSGSIRFAIHLPEAGGQISYTATIRADAGTMEPGTVNWTHARGSTDVGTWRALRLGPAAP